MYCRNLVGSGSLSTSWRMSQDSSRRSCRRHRHCSDRGSAVSCCSQSAIAGSELTAATRSVDVSARSSTVQTAPTSASSGNMSTCPYRRATPRSEQDCPPGPCHCRSTSQLYCNNDRTTCTVYTHSQVKIKGATHVHTFTGEVCHTRRLVYLIHLYTHSQVKIKGATHVDLQHTDFWIFSSFLESSVK